MHKLIDFMQASSGALLAGDVNHCKAAQVMKFALWQLYITQAAKGLDSKRGVITGTKLEWGRDVKFSIRDDLSWHDNKGWESFP